MNDFDWMQQALKQAEKGIFTTAPNPRVGCVIVRDGILLAQDYHRYQGQPHAEALALQQCLQQAEGATAYVSLEPCSHTGSNPPCADALIEAQVARVCVANTDPNPLVSGEGIKRLQAAGIDVEIGLCEAEGEALNCGFFKRMRTGLPWVRVKTASSLDGRTAMANGESYWITGEQARADVQYWRGRSQAIITGIGTVLQDDCRLTVRPEQLKSILPHDFPDKQPLRVILDSQLNIPLNAALLKQPDTVIVATTTGVNGAKIRELEALGVKVLEIASENKRIHLPSLLTWLGQHEINEVLVESGATLAGAFIEQGLADELLMYIAPVLMGSDAKPLFEINIEQMANRLHMEDCRMQTCGKDWRILARLKK
ncbi:bifunctional diaminohydroxyphosphoribosylaminopyrimidine deaminase/5-amino-6-(5-phosphoribosylamino)uracil reductase RibD [Marinicella sp. W31]|uniref:bifunctional diaminohydroxyphosphoribosylaminopyrimidine deaminase/5-amino-6-(5-phosphoribosylamino)uracil reductase RibD n=1 Tax=Marinicella sp. W31 TaxID=3023713 RepID=UPI0037575AF0